MLTEVISVDPDGKLCRENPEIQQRGIPSGFLLD